VQNFGGDQIAGINNRIIMLIVLMVLMALMVLMELVVLMVLVILMVLMVLMVLFSALMLDSGSERAPGRLARTTGA
jgi:hypothetical protein